MSVAMMIWIVVAVVVVLVVGFRVIRSLWPRCREEYKRRNDNRRPPHDKQWVVHDPGAHRWFELGSEAEECYLPGDKINA